MKAEARPSITVSRPTGSPKQYCDLRLALVLWTGGVGGAERFTVELAHAMRSMGADARIVFVGQPRPLSESLEALGVPYGALNLDRGRAVLRHPRRFAQIVAASGHDGVLLNSCGYQAAALWTGGFRGRVVAVEHGTLLRANRLTGFHRLVRRMDRASGVWSCDVEVAVSDYMLEEILHRTHAKRVVRIYNGVDLDRFKPTAGHAGRASNKPRYVIGCAGRLVLGKAFDDLIRAFARMTRTEGSILRIAGDGLERSRLEALAHRLGVTGSVEFLGWVNDMSAFWTECDVAAVPSRFESFCLAAVEPMASGIPVIATQAGALPEIVEDGHDGLLVAPGDIDGIAGALDRYSIDAALRKTHGSQARRTCKERFDLRRCAAEYLDMFAST